jgi:hypothetical protein
VDAPGAWTRSPLRFDNEYFRNLMTLTWQPRQWRGRDTPQLFGSTLHTFLGIRMRSRQERSSYLGFQIQAVLVLPTFQCVVTRNVSA